jgi:hypothetical protein
MPFSRYLSVASPQKRLVSELAVGDLATNPRLGRADERRTHKCLGTYACAEHSNMAVRLENFPGWEYARWTPRDDPLHEARWDCIKLSYTPRL